ncbi:bifunctional homocysteine S-methyltransferase/methylenetetrahydrofolate reductase [Mobilitalea sibirica]|uniref:Bifunctional homocysteine S-methyltransferase/methylenetetrahydrofolate reductase n=2 Tax=Mobilitalea sibirica TaxID=1462919 RepID=A0A8J7H2A3_9FIRM|nr:bifunctional homocysteine S-methyltransferase/methylenetetrahydrofolate reductase [Mobilitalea sibirica]
MKHRLIMDGSMGTYYSNLINLPGAFSETANLTTPKVIEQIHTEYILAGARMIRTNTFAANRAALKIDVKEQRLLVEAACRIAKNAVSEFTTDKNSHMIWIAGDVGPIVEDANSTWEEIFEEYKLLCDIFIDQGLHGIHFETFPSLKYIEELVPYIKERNKDMFILASFSLNKNGYSGAGISASRLMEKVGLIEGIDGCGFNCGVGSGHMYQIFKKVNFPDHKYIFAAPNAGYPEQMQNRMVFMDNEAYFAKNMRQIAELGTDLLGGCCGTTPAYMKAMIQNIDIDQPSNIRKKNQSQASGIETVEKPNDFYELFKSKKKVIAVELDPPYDANIDHILECAHILKNSKADIITFADSPLGRSRVDSILMSTKIAEETGLKVMPHVCCRDRNMISMRASLLGAYIHGIRNLLIVTGDPVPGDSRVSTTGVFDYNSIRLMEYVKEMNIEHFKTEPFYYGGALNHGRGSIEKVVARMKKKIDAGAKFFLTQPVYSIEDAERILRIKELVDTKILCGIMPLVSYRNANFIKNEFSGINVPDEIVNRYRPDMSKEEAELVGASIAREIMEFLEPVADGYYIMLPFNRVSLMEKIMG